MGLINIAKTTVLNWINLSRPIPIQFDITNSCNLNCGHCYHPHHKNSGAIPLDRWLKLLGEYASLISKLNAQPFVIFCGGEPLISPNLFPLLERCQQLWGKDYSSVVITNATTIPNKVSLLHSLDPETLSFQVSLDGPSASLHDFHRGPGSFELAKKGARTLVEAGFNVNILAVLSRVNAGHVPAFFDLAQDLGVKSMNFTRFIPVGTGSTFGGGSQVNSLSPLELRSAMIEIMRQSARTGVKTTIQTPLAALLHPDLGRSGRFWEALVIDYQGRYLATSRSRIPIGHIDHDSMESLLTRNPFFRPLVEKRVEVCGQCELYDRCGGDRNAAFAATGNFLGPDPGCWKGLSQV